MSEADKAELAKLRASAKQPSFVAGCTESFTDGVQFGCFVGGIVIVVGVAVAVVSLIQPKSN